MNLNQFNTIEWQVITTALFIILFEVLHIGQVIKRLIYKRNSIKVFMYKKPWDCRFCMSFWIGLLMSFYFILDPASFIIFNSTNLVISKIYDHVFTN